MANNTFGNIQVSVPGQSLTQQDSLQVSIPKRTVRPGSKMITAQASPLTVRKAAESSAPNHP